MPEICLPIESSQTSPLRSENRNGKLEKSPSYQNTGISKPNEIPISSSLDRPEKLSNRDLRILESCSLFPKSCYQISRDLNIPARSVRRHVAFLYDACLLRIGDSKQAGTANTEFLYVLNRDHKIFQNPQKIPCGHFWPHGQNQSEGSLGKTDGHTEYKSTTLGSIPKPSIEGLGLCTIDQLSQYVHDQLCVANLWPRQQEEEED